MQTSYIGYVLTAITVVVGFLSYERVVNKDKQEMLQSMTILSTKMDMLLSQNNNLDAKIKEHDALLNNHEIKLAIIDDTLRFRRIKDDEH